MKRHTVAVFLAGSLALLAGSTYPSQANSDTDSNPPGIAAPTCAEQTQLGLNRCADLWFKTADYFKGLVYEDLRQQLELSDRVQLAIAEEHWQVFRDTQCHLVSDPFAEGSIYSLIYASCLAEATNDRTADLQQWGEPTLSQRQADTQLAALLDELNLAASDSQQRWEAYRNLHCDFEASYRQDVNDAYQQCVGRLTETRILRLEALKDFMDM